MTFSKTKVFDVLNSKKQEPRRHTRNFEYGFFFFEYGKKNLKLRILTPPTKNPYIVWKMLIDIFDKRWLGN